MDGQCFSVCTQAASHVQLFFCTYRFEISRSAAAMFTGSRFLARLSVRLFLKQGLIRAAATNAALCVCSDRTIAYPLTSAFRDDRRTQFSVHLRFLYFFTRFLFILLNFKGSLFRFALLLGRVDLATFRSFKRFNSLFLLAISHFARFAGLLFERLSFGSLRFCFF